MFRLAAQAEAFTSSFIATSSRVSDTISLSPYANTWILDSGGTSHVSGNRSLFVSLRLDTKHNGSLIPIQGIGTVQISHKVTQFDILYVPQFPINLVYVCAITKTLNCSVTFFSSYCLSEPHDKGEDQWGA